MEHGTATVENNLVAPEEAWNYYTPLLERHPAHNCQEVETTQVSISWWVDNTAIERNKALRHTTACMNLEPTILSERSQSQKKRRLYDPT
jgi:hypothetical protein